MGCSCVELRSKGDDVRSRRFRTRCPANTTFDPSASSQRRYGSVDATGPLSQLHLSRTRRSDARTVGDAGRVPLHPPLHVNLHETRDPIIANVQGVEEVLVVQDLQDPQAWAGGRTRSRGVGPSACRRFSAKYKLAILRELDACTAPGSTGALLRREGLYSSHISTWRRQRETGELQGLAPKKGVPGRSETHWSRRWRVSSARTRGSRKSFGRRGWRCSWARRRTMNAKNMKVVARSGQSLGRIYKCLVNAPWAVVNVP